MENLIRDVKHGMMSLLRDKGFAATVILTLAVGIAGYTATFAIVHSVLLRPLPGPNADAIVLMSNEYPKAGAADQSVSAAPDYFDRLRAVTALEEQALFQENDAALEINGTPQRVSAMNVTPSFFRVVEISPARGRAFTAEEGEVGNENKVILSDALWHQLYGGDPSALGRELRLGGTPFTIVGVMPKEFVFVDPEVRLWVPVAFTPEQKTEYHNNQWGHIGRLKPGATTSQVQAQVNALNAANLDRFPAFKDFLVNAGFYTRVEPLQHALVKSVESALYLLWGGAVFVVLIGGLNVTNLAVARSNSRSKEIATRLALGAGRAQIARQMIAENVLLAGAGGIAGVLLGRALLRAVAAMGLDQFPRAYEVRIDGSVVLVSLGLAVVVGVLVGLVPLASAFKVNLSGVLRDSGRTGTSGVGTRRLRQGLVSAEIGLAFVLLAGAGLLLASFRHLLAVDPGFNTSGVMTASVTAPASRYRGGGELRILMTRALDSIRRLPGVAAAGATNDIPFGNNENDIIIMAEGYVMKPGESLFSPYSLIVTPGYFETMNIALVRGRYFDDHDNETAPQVVIVDEQLARHFWPNRDPIGQRMYQSDNLKEPNKSGAHTSWYQVVGVVRSITQEDLAGTRSAFGAYYFPYAQHPTRDYTFAVRTAGKAGGVTSMLRAAMAQIDPELPLFDVKTMVERTALSMASRHASLTLALAFGALALFLSAIGIYGVLSYLMAQRRREIAIRMALGSSGAAVIRLVVKEGLALVSVGFALGFIGAAALHKIVASQIYGVRAWDPLVLGGVSVLLGMIALAACTVPARRATRIDPIEVLRYE
ncbi:MAG TPA: ABC transporter permease [Terriglobia bacterium]|nr:ABC transporter permease [Terriglobia bacterium]